MTQAFLNVLVAGRYLQGDIYEPNEEDMQGNPLVVKNGPNKGKERKEWFIAIGVQKTPGATHWSQEPWGAPIWAFGHAQWPNGQGSNPTFAWKIEDGDSMVPNKRGRKNGETEGMPGHWIVKFSTGYAPKIYNAEAEVMSEPGAVKCGYFVRISGNVTSNMNDTNPGIYMNFNMVQYLAWMKEISRGPDAKTVFKEKNYTLPPGASLTPQAGSAPLPSAPPPAAGAPPPAYVPPPGAGAPPPPAAAAPAAPPAASTPVVPSAAFVGTPGAPPPPPPAASGPQMTAKANGLAYSAFIAQGWNDTNLRAQGYMV